MRAQPVDTSVLAHCVAIVVSQNKEDGEALMRLAERLRFGAVIAHSPKLKPEPFNHRLVFFLVHFDFANTARMQLLRDLRHFPSVSLAYAPVVMFLRDASAAQIRAGIEMGFDDVINVPGEGPDIAHRLASQIGREHLYVETRTYLGPDRHRMDRFGPGPAQRQAEEPHARLFIMRTVEEGVHIVRREDVHKAH
jgi:DNA-binding NarL/FixJ family response regulator